MGKMAMLKLLHDADTNTEYGARVGDYVPIILHRTCDIDCHTFTNPGHVYGILQSISAQHQDYEFSPEELRWRSYEKAVILNTIAQEQEEFLVPLNQEEATGFFSRPESYFGPPDPVPANADNNMNIDPQISGQTDDEPPLPFPGNADNNMNIHPLISGQIDEEPLTAKIGLLIITGENSILTAAVQKLHDDFVKAEQELGGQNCSCKEGLNRAVWFQGEVQTEEKSMPVITESLADNLVIANRKLRELKDKYEGERKEQEQLREKVDGKISRFFFCQASISLYLLFLYASERSWTNKR